MEIRVEQIKPHAPQWPISARSIVEIGIPVIEVSRAELEARHGEPRSVSHWGMFE